MKQRLHFRFFAHSWVSDWNHGNAHFLRGLVRELIKLGHEVRCYEELGAWSLKSLVSNEKDLAVEAIDTFRQTYPELDVHFYQQDDTLDHFLDAELRGADIVILHEWNDPKVVNAVLERKDRFGFRVLLHDTHHRAYTAAGQILQFQLHRVDGVLAFGDAIRRIYQDGFGIPNVWTFHEAADTSVFKPLDLEKEWDLLWIGNWGDEERTRELMEYLVGPAHNLPHRKILVHGVRYPDAGVRVLKEAGIEYRGYLPNLSAPVAYAHSRLALHVPRRQYTNGLSGIPTIRVFEALACGATLVCAPWNDAEGLFRPGEDYVIASNSDRMTATIEELSRDQSARAQIARSGLETIRKRHTCHHRAQQLLEISEELGR
ncbi:MAG: glycosyltransferase [Terriglobia bacterium]|jgi:spore maturation protein CgeB|nr:glycosyltransferase [Terriglobia bacterium]